MTIMLLMISFVLTQYRCRSNLHNGETIGTHISSIENTPYPSLQRQPSVHSSAQNGPIVLHVVLHRLPHDVNRRLKPHFSCSWYLTVSTDTSSVTTGGGGTTGGKLNFILLILAFLAENAWQTLTTTIAINYQNCNHKHKGCQTIHFRSNFFFVQNNAEIQEHVEYVDYTVPD